MSKRIDLTGQRFGRLEVLETAGKDKQGKLLWLCRCDCGETTIGRSYRLSAGEKLSCGCLGKEIVSSLRRSRAHGHGRVFETRRKLGLSRNEFAALIGCNDKTILEAEKHDGDFHAIKHRKAFNKLAPQEAQMSIGLRVPQIHKRDGALQVLGEVFRCENADCNRVFSRPRDSRKSIQNFCSPACKKQAMKRHIDFLCSCGCGAVVRRPPCNTHPTIIVFHSLDAFGRFRSQMAKKQIPPSIRLTPEQVARLDSLRPYPDAPLAPAQIEWALNPPAEVALDERRKPREKSKATRSIEVLSRESKRAKEANEPTT